MCLSNTDKELISKLKGRLSKALNVQSRISKDERMCMEGIYETLDRAILNPEDTSEFAQSMVFYTEGLKRTKRKFIKEHIIPLANKVATKKWGIDG